MLSSEQEQFLRELEKTKSTWQEKRSFYERKLVITDSVNKEFEINKEIQRCDEEIKRITKDIESLKKESKSPNNLAQQLRDWFTALDYEFEDYNEQDHGSFQWIIRIPKRRGGFDRILVFGLTTQKANTSHINILNNLVQSHKTNEGWLITECRKVNAVDQNIQQCKNLFYNTLDEIIDQNANFNSYFQWLEAEIKTRKINHLYVDLEGNIKEIHLSTGKLVGVSHYGDNNHGMKGEIDRWLGDCSKEHISILGEFGTGKTWFCLHYAWTVYKEYKKAKDRGLSRPRIPLVIPLRDYIKAVNIDNVVSHFFFSKHNIRLNAKTFEQLNKMGKLLLIFDGFDEMATKVNRDVMIDNFWQLTKAIVPQSKVILTCRTEHLISSVEGRKLLNAELKNSAQHSKSEPYRFEILEIEPFNPQKIEKALQLLTNNDNKIVKTIVGNSRLLELASRPLLIDLIFRALPDLDLTSEQDINISKIYLFAVKQKMSEDIKRKRTFTSLADKLYFLCEISWKMLSENVSSITIHGFRDFLLKYFKLNQSSLENWEHDMKGQTILVRHRSDDEEENDNYSIPHRSWLEFFVAYKFAAELGIIAPDFMSLATEQSNINKASEDRDYTWSEYFQTERHEKGEIKTIARLKGFKHEPLEKTISTFGKEPLTETIIQLLLPMLDRTNVKEHLFGLVQNTQGKRSREVGYMCGNLVKLLLEIDPYALEGRDLSRCHIEEIDFTKAKSLRNTNFCQTTFSENSIVPEVLGGVLSVAFSPNGKQLVTGDMNDEVRLWNFSYSSSKVSIEFNTVLSEHKNWIRSLAFSPDGATLASAGDDETIKLWNLQANTAITLGKNGENRENRDCQHTDWVRAVAFSPNGKILASASGDKTIKLWNVETTEYLHTFEGHTDWVRAVAFSSNGKILASASVDKTIKLWDVIEKTEITLPNIPKHEDSANSVAFSPNGKYLASGGKDNTVRLWNIETGECLKILDKHTDRVNFVTFSPDGSVLASASGDKTVRLWKIEDRESEILEIEEHETLKDHHDSAVRSIAFYPQDTTILITAAEDETVIVWSTETGKCLYTLRGLTNPVRTVAFDGRNNLIASCGSNTTVKVWNISDNKQNICQRIFKADEKAVRTVALNYKNQALVTGGEDGFVRLWKTSMSEVESCYQLRKKFEENKHESRINSTIFSSSGKFVVSTSDDKKVKLWDVNSESFVRDFTKHQDSVRYAVFSPDEKVIASASDDGTVRLWDINTGHHVILEEQDNHRRMWCVAFSPDGNIVAGASSDRTIKLWKLSDIEIHSGKSYKPWKVLAEHQDLVRFVIFSPNGKFLASGSGDKTLKLWDVENWECIVTFDKSKEGHEHWVRTLAFSSDSNLLVSGSWDQTIKLWDVENKILIQEISNKPFSGMNITSIQGLNNTQKKKLRDLGAKKEGID